VTSTRRRPTRRQHRPRRRCRRTRRVDQDRRGEHHQGLTRPRHPPPDHIRDGAWARRRRVGSESAHVVPCAL